ncbi:GNAT family N-acetyltransferase [Paenarthrobacter sp. Z7-10]|uniref:GNAT family N-acetyltransferase n=1 Tax=Paenarthrobacter sp. Z7-10 TaxID=2787635 RepID=UPI0022A979E5|nr:GNAT family N-acetyltransferase [Paenarthrobacter sp. Z7-10]MCZ2402119.1 GNAT family N-acetyltransferase [Paenarthrobacter sp. Z7-10]
MSFDDNSAAIVLLAWERRLGFGDGTLSTGLERHVRHDDGATSVSFLRLFGRSALVGPGWAVEAAAGLDDDELADHSTLLRLTREHGGHGLGTAALYFADDLPLVQPSGDLSVSRDPAHALALQGLCPPDDANEFGLPKLKHSYTVMLDGGPVACGAFTEWQGIVARLGVLVAPPRRGAGLGKLAGAIAAHEALASGLVLQWRADVSNAAANATAHSLGFLRAGTQTSVLLG